MADAVSTTPISMSMEAPAQVDEDRGFKVLNQGEIGTGKTFSLESLAEAGLEVFVLHTEHTSVKFKHPKMHWNFVHPRTSSWDAMIKSAKNIAQFSAETLAKMTDNNRVQEYGQFIQLLEMLSNFKDLRTGKSFGPVDEWDVDKAFALDALSGTNKMCLDLVTGSRVSRSQPEWGIAMDTQMRLISKLVACKCHFVLNAHIEPERDEVSGAVKNYASAIGRKNGPNIGKEFDEVLLSYRVGGTYLWSNSDDKTPTKRRLLPQGDKLIQGYGQLVSLWEKERQAAKA